MKIPFNFFIFFLFQLGFSKSILPTYSPDIPKPTQTEIRYGKHERNVLDFWQVVSKKLLLFPILFSNCMNTALQIVSTAGSIIQMDPRPSIRTSLPL